MRLEDVTAEIRPRTDWEAVDLGFALVRRNFWRCLAVWWLAMLPPLLVAGWLLRDYPAVLVILFWWVMPAGSRMVLFELSRRLFGEKPTWKAVFRELPKVWVRRFFHRFVWARFSPWLSVMLAVEDLEGMRGQAYRQRAAQLGRRGEGAVMWVFSVGMLAGCWLALALFFMAWVLIPEGQEGVWRVAMEAWDAGSYSDIPQLIIWSAAICLMAGAGITDLFTTGAGFGIYVNNRTWLEGWDVELAFRRLAARLGKVAAALVLLLALAGAPLARARDAEVARARDAEVIREVKENPDFKVHSTTIRTPVATSSGSRKPSGSGGLDAAFIQALGYTMLGALVIAMLWMLWKMRHSFKPGAPVPERRREAPRARVVMGMEITAGSLPADIPGAAWALWQQGRRQDALGLLYRGAISKVIEVGQAEIQESDTEGDCLGRVEAAGAPAHPAYFRDLTGTWIRLAYAGQEPPDAEVQALCSAWPFGGRRNA